MSTNRESQDESINGTDLVGLDALQGDEIATMNGESLLEDDSGLLSSDPDLCAICGKPFVIARMLHCLHVFCEQCLDKKLVNEGGDAGSAETKIECPTCNYVTVVGVRKLGALPLDVTKLKSINDLTILNASLHCTCCTTKEMARSRCNTCHNLLCSNCDSAHHYMRCFESHKVTNLVDEILPMKSLINGHTAPDSTTKSSTPVDYPSKKVCQLHGQQPMNFYCNTCFMIVCADCVNAMHLNHDCNDLMASEIQVREELKSMLMENQTKVDYLNTLTHVVDNNLQELAHQRSVARDLINESYHSYKAALEKCRDEMLDHLNNVYHERELLIMKENDSIGKTIGNFKDAQQYVERFLSVSTVNELMYLRKTISDRLLVLRASAQLLTHENLSLEFVTNTNKFTESVKKHFGLIQTEDIKHNHQASNCNSSNTSPISITSTSMHSSFDSGDQYHRARKIVIGQTSPQMEQKMNTDIVSPPSVPALAGFNSIAGYNLAQLASLAESSPSHERPLLSTNMISRVANGTPSPPTPPPLPSNLQHRQNTNTALSSHHGYQTSTFSLADLLTSDTAYNNLASLAKLGAFSADNTPHNGHATSTSSSPLTLSNVCLLQNSYEGAFGSTAAMSSSSTTSPISLSDHDHLSDQYFPLQSTTNSNGTISHCQSQNHNPTLLAVNPIIPYVGPSNGNQTSTLPLPGSLSPSVAQSTGSTAITTLRSNKVSPMQIRNKFGQLGPSKGQFNSPHGFCLGLDEDIIVADTNNHRIQVFDKTGTFKYQFGTSGKEEGQLWYPRKVAVMRNNGKFVVCDRGNERSRMQIFSKNGHFLKKIPIRYIDIVAGLAVTASGDIVAVDSVSPTVFIIAESGDLTRWFDCSDFMREPSDIAIHGKEFYVCDFKGHNVVVFGENGKYLRRIGYENVTSFPNGIDISDAGDILIGDSHGNRFHVAVFSREGVLISEFECPYVKVSRCCGLKITSEGYVVTLAKNNHHVLVLNTLYIL